MTKRAVLCVPDPWNHMDRFPNHSIMILNPTAPPARNQYLIDNADWSIMLTEHDIATREGGDHPGERIFVYTSGTTGDSKFFGFSQAQLDTICDTMIRSYDFGPNDRYYGFMPMHHGHGLIMYWALRRAGADCRFGNVHSLGEMETFQPTFLTGIPDLLRTCARLRLNHLRFVRSASAALPLVLYDQLRERWSCPVIEAFGMTEAISHCFTNPLRGPQRPGTVGLPDGIKARIDDLQRLWIQGPCVHDPGWIDTGDLARQDDQGYFEIIGRSIDRINVRGIKIDPLSIENQLLNRFPEIEECAVFGKDRLCCLIKGSVETQLVNDFLLDLGPHCRPRLLNIVDSIPRNNAGKISRSLLVQQYLGDQQPVND